MKRAFTLIELLVVIAIIAILAAILFPVFAQAKAAAKKTAALSNAKQLGLGVMLYSGDVDDMYPKGSGACWWQPIDGGWVYLVQPYVKNTQIFQTASDPKSKATWPGWMTSQPDAVNISFAANGFMKWDGTGWGMYGIMGMDQAHRQVRADGSCDSGNGWMDKGDTNGTAVTKPAETIMLAESYNYYPVWGPSDFVTSINWWDYVGTGGWIPDSRRDGTAYKVNGVTFTVNNKNGGINANDTAGVAGSLTGKNNYVWADGHAKSMTPLATTGDPTDPTKNLWDSSRN